MNTEISIPYRRIAVAGATGSGKSTLAEQLAGRFDLDFIELDALNRVRTGLPPESNCCASASKQPPAHPAGSSPGITAPCARPSGRAPKPSSGWIIPGRSSSGVCWRAPGSAYGLAKSCGVETGNAWLRSSNSGQTIASSFGSLRPTGGENANIPEHLPGRNMPICTSCD